MKVKALMECEVDGKKHKKGDEFDIANSAAAYRAQTDGVVKVIEPPKAEK